METGPSDISGMLARRTPACKRRFEMAPMKTNDE
jgi:hypothetical protein